MRSSCLEYRKVFLWVLHGWINYYFRDLTSNPANGQAPLMGRVPPVEKHRSRPQKKSSMVLKGMWKSSQANTPTKNPTARLLAQPLRFRLLFGRCQFRISASQRLSWLGFFCGFLSLLEQMKGQYVKLGHDRFILHPFQFIIHSLEVA
jgi:hypothetical protein